MEALTNDPAVVDDHGADHRIWAGGPPAPRGQAKGLGHVPVILGVDSHRFMRLARDRRREPVDLDARDEDDALVFFFASPSANAAWAAASRAMATR
jgi:hypothetical protein